MNLADQIAQTLYEQANPAAERPWDALGSLSMEPWQAKAEAVMAVLRRAGVDAWKARTKYAIDALEHAADALASTIDGTLDLEDLREAEKDVRARLDALNTSDNRKPAR